MLLALKHQHVVVNINESSFSLFAFYSFEPATCWVQRVSFFLNFLKNVSPLQL